MSKLKKASEAEVKLSVWCRVNDTYTLEIAGRILQNFHLNDRELRLIEKNAKLKEKNDHYLADTFTMTGLDSGMDFRKYLEGLAVEKNTKK